MKLYLKFVAMQLKCQMQYKTSFVMTALGQFLTSFTAFLSVLFLFNRFHSVQDYSFSEVLICFSVMLTSFSLTECFVRGLSLIHISIGYSLDASRHSIPQELHDRAQNGADGIRHAARLLEKRKAFKRFIRNLRRCSSCDPLRAIRESCEAVLLRKIERTVSVSYTHLAVYKRQDCE